MARWSRVFAAAALASIFAFGTFAGGAAQATAREPGAVVRKAAKPAKATSHARKHAVRRLPRIVQPDPYYSYYGAPGFYGYGWCRQEAFGAYTLAGRQVGNWPVSVCRW